MAFNVFKVQLKYAVSAEGESSLITCIENV